MPLETCEKCGKRFRVWQSASERLLNAIFGRHSLCKKCTLEANYPKCTECGEVTTSGLAFNGKPYHPDHMPYANQEPK